MGINMKTTIKRLLITLLSISLLFTCFIAAFWAPDKNLEELKAKWGQAPSLFMAVDGIEVHYRDEGPRDHPLPIVLIHGTSASLHTWDGWVEELKQERRIIRFDLPGFGLTGQFPDNNYSIDSYVTFVESVLNQLGVQEFIIGGNSLGGQVAWATAVRFSERVKKTILVDAAGYSINPYGVPMAWILIQLPIVDTVMEKILPRAVVESSIKNLYGDPARVSAKQVDRYFDITLRSGNRSALKERLRIARSEKVSDLVKKVSQPTLIIWGKRDELILLENAERFARDIPQSRLVVFEQLGHVPQEENPEVTVQAVKEFLSK
jgi:pimeloyl-ACP methyl ester carboxylesterase